MGSIASQITSLTIVYSAVCSGANQRKHQSSASVAFVRGIHWGPVNSPHKWPVTRKIFPFDDVIMRSNYSSKLWTHALDRVIQLPAVFSWRRHGMKMFSVSMFLCGLPTTGGFSSQKASDAEMARVPKCQWRIATMSVKHCFLRYI